MNRLTKYILRRLIVKKLSTWFNVTQLVNLAGFAAQFLEILPPSLQSNRYVIFVQGALAILLPSLGGIGHRIAYGKSPTQ